MTECAICNRNRKVGALSVHYCPAPATSKIHRSAVGTYHPAENSEVAWTVNDTRGYIDGGPSCDECGACECEDHDSLDFDRGDECIGLSFAYVCLDGGDVLCETCFEKDGSIEVVPCDCE